MVENQLIDVVEVQKHIDLQKQVVQLENELESDLEDEVSDLGDVVEEITSKLTRDSSIAMFCYEKRSSEGCKARAKDLSRYTYVGQDFTRAGKPTVGSAAPPLGAKPPKKQATTRAEY
ncbi:hypothetical protein Tco_1084205 [Tanacetum coccineum]